MQKVFVDGAAGTVGSALQPYLEKLTTEGLIDVIELGESDRKVESWRRQAIREANVVVLCLPDEAAISAVNRVEIVNPGARILDASAVHRCEPGWVYGLQELVSREAIASAKRVANPGCFATACILAGKPLVDAFGLETLQFQGITGYTAGGRKGNADGKPQLVQFGREHRHLPEIARYTGALPVLTTTVGPWAKGMLVQTFVLASQRDVMAAYKAAWGRHGITISTAQALGFRVDPQACNGTTDVLICVAEQPSGGCSVAVVLDNLGKGSAGTAALNLQLMVS